MRIVAERLARAAVDREPVTTSGLRRQASRPRGDTRVRPRRRGDAEAGGHAGARGAPRRRYPFQHRSADRPARARRLGARGDSHPAGRALRRARPRQRRQGSAGRRRGHRRAGRAQGRSRHRRHDLRRRAAHRRRAGRARRGGSGARLQPGGAAPIHRGSPGPTRCCTNSLRPHCSLISPWRITAAAAETGRRSKHPRTGRRRSPRSSRSGVWSSTGSGPSAKHRPTARRSPRGSPRRLTAVARAVLARLYPE